MWALATGFFSTYVNYFKAGLAIIVLGVVYYGGFHMGNSKYLAYKAEVEVAAKVQEAEVESIQKQHALVTKGISDEYEAKLVTLRNYYKSTSVWNSPNSSAMSGISTAPKSANVIASYNELTGNCAQTTLMLVELQKWLNEQIGIK